MVLLGASGRVALRRHIISRENGKVNDVFVCYEQTIYPKHQHNPRTSGPHLTQPFIPPRNLHPLLRRSTPTLLPPLTPLARRIHRPNQCRQLFHPLLADTHDMQHVPLHEPLGGVVAQQRAREVGRPALFYEQGGAEGEACVAAELRVEGLCAC